MVAVSALDLMDVVDLHARAADPKWRILALFADAGKGKRDQHTGFRDGAAIEEVPWLGIATMHLVVVIIEEYLVLFDFGFSKEGLFGKPLVDEKLLDKEQG